MGSGCAGRLSVLPFVRLCFGQNEAVRCMGHRSALHHSSQCVATVHAARCVWRTSLLSSFLCLLPWGIGSGIIGWRALLLWPKEAAYQVMKAICSATEILSAEKRKLFPLAKESSSADKRRLFWASRKSVSKLLGCCYGLRNLMVRRVDCTVQERM